MTLKIDKDEVFERSHGERSIVTYDHTKVVLGFFLHSATFSRPVDNEGDKKDEDSDGDSDEEDEGSEEDEDEDDS